MSFMNKELLEHGFWGMACWRLKKMFSLHLQLACGNCRSWTAETVLSSTVSDWGCVPWFPMKCPARAVARSGSAHCGSCMMVFYHIFACSVDLLEHSWTMDMMRWIGSMTCSFFWFKLCRFLCLETFEVCCICCRSQWHPGLAAENTERIGDDSCDTRNFPMSQAFTVKTCNFLCWISRWTHFIFRRPWLGNHTSEGQFHKTFFFLHYGVDAPSVGLAMCFCSQCVCRDIVLSDHRCWSLSFVCCAMNSMLTL